MEETANCFKCKHFVITWDTRLPYGCKGWKIKSKQYPNVVVRGSSGMECQLFQAKGPGKKGTTPSA